MGVQGECNTFSVRGPVNPAWANKSRTFNSNELDKSDVQYEKHELPRISTLCGIKITFNGKPEKAESSIWVN
jgi:hypothetical protein